jgi:hypothetical protein
LILIQPAASQINLAAMPLKVSATQTRLEAEEYEGKEPILLARCE